MSSRSDEYKDSQRANAARAGLSDRDNNPTPVPGRYPWPAIDLHEITRQRALGWPDIHPEEYCHRCGRLNIKSWFSPEWVTLTGSHSGILCPVCFALHDPKATWVLTRWTPHDEAQRALLTEELLAVAPVLGEDAERVAGCVLDAAASPRSSTPSMPEAC